MNCTNPSRKGNLAAQANHDETHYYKEKKSGFSASGSSIGYGKSKLQTTNDTQQIINVGSTVGSVEGNVNIHAGKKYTQTGSDILTPHGSIRIIAQKEDFNTATDTYANQQTMKYKQSGITVGVANPIISAAQTVNQMKEAASQTSDSRMQALAAGTAALAVNNAANSLHNTDAFGNVPTAGNTGPNDLTNVTQTNAADQVGGISLNISIGTSKAKSSSSQTVNTAKSSNLNAGGDIQIIATGAGKDSDINIIGSTIKAAHNVTIKAEDQITLQAAQNTSQLQSKNKSSSASVGVSVNLGAAGGVGVTAGLSKGNTSGNSTSWTETLIQGGNQQGDQVTLSSGADTNLIGAQVSGNQVTANVGIKGEGNLNIQSLQDTDQYKAKQSSNGISVTVPVTGTGYGGSFSSNNSNTKSNYQSVNEQSGIFAGDGGFQINVNGNTDLKGAVVASTQSAIDNNKNTLTTQTLTTSNIENKAEYEAKATSATVGYGIQGGLPQLSGAGIGQDEGKVGSTTVSAVSAGEVNIKEADITKTQLSRDVHVERDSEGNVIALNGQGNNLAATVNPIFDADKVAKEINAQVQITEAFGQQAGQAVATYVRAQRAALLTQYKNATTDKEKLEIKAQMDEVTREERVMNILIGAVTGMPGTAVTKEGLSITADHLRQFMIEDSKKFPGVTDGTTTLTNTSGDSEGVRGDGEKVGGTRIDLDKLCGTSNERCATNDDGSLKLNEKGQVQFDADAAGMSLSTFLETDLGKEAAGATGGIQGWKGTLFGTPYVAGSWQDKLIEAFSGTHDFVGGKLSGLYDEQGNATRGRDEVLIKLQDTWSASGAIVVSSPFAMAEFLEPQVWQAISILLKGAK